MISSSRGGSSVQILLLGHVNIPTKRGTATTNPRSQLAKDIVDLRNNTNVGNDSLLKLLQLNKEMYPKAYEK